MRCSPPSPISSARPDRLPELPVTQFDNMTRLHLGAIEFEGRRYSVAVTVSYDGIEYVGRLWFADEAWVGRAFTDRGAIPGRTRDEVLATAKALSQDELVARYRRAMSERRRYHGLRRSTEDILAKVRYLNQVAVSLRAGLLDAEGAAAEIDITEHQLHRLVDELRHSAGMED